MKNKRITITLSILVLACLLATMLYGAGLRNDGLTQAAKAQSVLGLASTATQIGPVEGVYNDAHPNGQTSIIPGRWRNIRPTESYLNSVSMLPSTYPVDCTTPGQESKGWIVGNFGTILQYCNGYWDHAITTESVPTDLYAVQAISPTLGVSVGDQGTVLMYLWDRIALDWVWTKSPIPVGNQTLYSISMVPDGTGNYVGWAVGHAPGDVPGKGTLVKGTITPTTIQGHPSNSYTWSNLTSSFPSLPDVTSYYAVQMLAPDNGWAVGGIWPDYGVIIHWDGTRWETFQETGQHTLYGLYMRSATDGWAVGQDGVIYHFNGTSWTQTESPTADVLTDVGFTPSGEGWIVGYDGTLLKYSGGKWNIFTDLRTDHFDFRSIDFTSGHGWMTGAHYNKLMGGQILEYADNLWQSVTPPTDNKLNDVSVLNDNDAWAVGIKDEYGGTIIHWDGKHWQRWFQRDLPIPAADLVAIDMVSATDGWAAGAPLIPGGPAVFLHWDGNRWAQPRYDAPVNVTVNDIAMLDEEFGWAVADNGNAVAKYDGLSGYWSANHSCGGFYYQLRGDSIVPYSNQFGWEAFAVGTETGLPDNAWKHYFLRYQGGCSGGYAWDVYDYPEACPLPTPVPIPPTPPQPPVIPPDGPVYSTLYDIKMNPDLSGYSVGDYHDRATIYYVSPGGNGWNVYFCQAEGPGAYNPSRFYAVDVVADTGNAWVGGYYTDPNGPHKVAYISYVDENGRWWAGDPFPLEGRNIYHRPIKSIEMSSDTMGWAVGDSETAFSVIYQYPFPNFTLDTSPAFRAVKPGSSTTYTATVYSLGGFNTNVSLSTEYLPTGVTVNITPNSINNEQVATLQVNTTAGTSLGAHSFYLEGYAVIHTGDEDVPVWRYAPLRLSVTNQPIYGVSPEQGPSGTVVTITGDGFGTDPGAGNRSTATNHVILAGRQLPDANVTSWSNTQITVSVPDNPTIFPEGAQKDIVSVTAGGQNSNEDYLFYLQNYLSSAAVEGDTDGFLVTLTGTGFGNDPGALFRSTQYEHIKLGAMWIPNDQVISWNNNTIVFRVPLGTSSGTITIASNGFESNGIFAMFDAEGVYLPIITR